MKPVLLAAAAAVVAVAGAVAWLGADRDGLAGQTPKPLADGAGAPTQIIAASVGGGAVETTAGGVMLGVQVEGDPQAKVHVIEYASLTCPHCAQFQAEVFPQLKKEYIDTGKISYELREAYFDRFGLMAAMVARCGGPDRYFGFVDLFLTRQSRWARADDIPAELAKMGRQGGLTEEQVNTCLKDTTAERALVEMYQGYRNDPRFTGTPTLIVGEEKIANPSWENLKAAIDAAL